MAFALLSRLAPTLLNKWQCEGNFGQARLSLMLIGAAHEPRQLPEGTLFQANIQQWPYPDMTEWIRLWNAVLFSDDALVFIDGGEYKAMIDAARQAVDEALMKENGALYPT